MLGTIIALGAASAVGSLAVPSIRKSLLTRHIQKAFAGALPRVSETEAAALEAGTSGPEAAFFKGDFNLSAIENRPTTKLSSDELHFIQKVVDPLLARLDDDAIMKEGDLPADVWTYLKEHKFFGLCIPKDLGGLGFSHRAHSDIVMRIAAVSPSVAVTVMVPNSLGPAELLLHYGTEEQVQHWVPRLAAGAEIPCFALTSPWAGSDAASIPDTGVIVPLHPEDHGKKGLPADKLGLKLNWNKRYITLAPVATVMGLAFQTRDPDQLLGGSENLGITVALIPTSHDGVKTGKRHRPMDAAFANGPTEGKDVVIPLSWVIGGASQVGKGWRMLMECLSVGRAISLPALGVAMSKQTLVTTARYARLRQQFKLPIGKFHAVAQPLAQIAVNAHLAHCTRTFAVDALDQGERSSVASAIAKYHLTELARESVSHGMDILGGKAICQGPSNLLGTAWKLSPIAITVEGANILTRSLIIFGQGAVRSHPYVLEEMRSANDRTSEGLDKFDKAFWAHAKKMAKDTLVADAHPLLTFGVGDVNKNVQFAKPQLKQARVLAKKFSFLAEMFMVRYGGDLKKQELLSARLGDVVSWLYMAAAVYRDAAQRDWRALKAPADFRHLVSVTLQYALHKAEAAMRELVENSSGSLFRGWVRHTVFPFGNKVKPVSDKQWLKLSGLLMDSPQFVEMFEEGLMPARNLAGTVHQDLALAVEDAKVLADSGVNWKNPDILAVQGLTVRTAAANYKERVDRLIQVDSVGAWGRLDAGEAGWSKLD